MNERNLVNFCLSRECFKMCHGICHKSSEPMCKIWFQWLVRPYNICILSLWHICGCIPI
jgi:hypothetical protein